MEERIIVHSVGDFVAVAIRHRVVQGIRRRIQCLVHGSDIDSVGEWAWLGKHHSFNIQSASSSG